MNPHNLSLDLYATEKNYFILNFKSDLTIMFMVLFHFQENKHPKVSFDFINCLKRKKKKIVEFIDSLSETTHSTDIKATI